MDKYLEKVKTCHLFSEEEKEQLIRLANILTPEAQTKVISAIDEYEASYKVNSEKVNSKLKTAFNNYRTAVLDNKSISDAKKDDTLASSQVLENLLIQQLD